MFPCDPGGDLRQDGRHLLGFDRQDDDGGMGRQFRIRLVATDAESPQPPQPGTISRYETGRREPSLLVLLEYARLAGISTDVLIDDRLNLPK